MTSISPFMSGPWIQQKNVYLPGFVNVTDDECGSGTGPGPIVTGVAKKPLPWFVPS